MFNISTNNQSSIWDHDFKELNTLPESGKEFTDPGEGPRGYALPEGDA